VRSMLAPIVKTIIGDFLAMIMPLSGSLSDPDRLHPA